MVVIRGCPEVTACSRRSLGNRLAAAAFTLSLAQGSVWLSATPAAADSACTETPGVTQRRGPSEIRDEHVLAQPRLTLPAASTRTAPAGCWSFSAATLWSSTFSWNQDEPGETPARRYYLLDAETATLDASVRRGLRPGLDVALRVPLRWRGGGRMDGLIDAWHRAFGFPTGNRGDFLANAFRVAGMTTTGTPFSWTGERGAGLGALELETRWRFRDRGPDGASLALVGRVALPTATGPFRGHGTGAGAQLVLGAPLGRELDLYAGVGATAQGRGPVDGVAYEATRGHGFLAVEWRPSRRLSLVAETDAAGRLVANVERYPATHWMLNVTGRIDLGRRTRLDLGFTENVRSQLSTTDFALYAAVALRP